MADFAAWLASLPLGQALRRLHWLVQWLQIIHILANGIIISAVVMIELRALGLSRALVTGEMARRFQSWIWGALAVLTVSGLLLLLYTPRRSLADLAFQTKMATMGLAIAATIGLLWAMRPRRAAAVGAAATDNTDQSALAALLATLALTLWVVVTLAGRGRWFALMVARMMS
jgi:uncharacterized membrane protein